MKLSKTLAVIAIAGGLSTSAQATPSVDSLLTKLVSTAIAVTVEEMNNEVRESVVNTAYHADSAVLNARVEIKEIASTAESSEDE